MEMHLDLYVIYVLMLMSQNDLIRLAVVMQWQFRFQIIFYKFFDFFFLEATHVH